MLFATSNRGKLQEARLILEPFGVEVERFDGKGVEIQADTTAQVAAYSSRGAATAAGRAVLVEDAGLFIDSLKGFPGVYSAYVYKTVGVDGVVALLGGSTGRGASFVSSLAYCEPGGEPTPFEGRAIGNIAERPRGAKGFGFDPIFIPEGGKKTFGELSLDEKCRISHRGDSMRKFASWFLAEG